MEHTQVDVGERIAFYPKNRLGQPSRWAEWFVTHHVPENVEKICCLCGSEGLCISEAIEEAIRAGRRCRSFTDRMNAESRTREEIVHRGVLLRPFELLATSFREFFRERRLKICGACIRFHYTVR